MLSSLLLKLLDPIADDTFETILKRDYPDNVYAMVSIGEKLGVKAIVEACMRAELGTELQLPMGSPLQLSPWEKILLSPKQLFELPSPHLDSIETQTVIGPNAQKPLTLDIPIMITGMSYGGSLNLEMKMALAKGASLAGTSTNTGESTVTDEERSCAKYLIGQYNRGGWLCAPEDLKQLDAIEIQMGQGAFGGAVESTIKGDTIKDHLRQAWQVEKGEDATIYARMPYPPINSPEQIIKLVKDLKSKYPVPVGLKIAGSDYIEQELALISKTNADFIVIDGSEGGTAAAPPTLADNVGLPTLFALRRAVLWLEKNQLRDKFTLIAAGGLKSPGHFLKALALGADAVYIGSIALIAAIQSQIAKAMPQSPSIQLALYNGKLTDQLDIDQAAHHLANFLKSCVAEMKLAAQALGKKRLSELNSHDLVTVDPHLAQALQIRYAGSPRA